MVLEEGIIGELGIVVATVISLISKGLLNQLLQAMWWQHLSGGHHVL